MRTDPPVGSPFYEVHVADNFHYIDTDAVYTARIFSSGEEALAKCREIVGWSLEECMAPGRSAADVFGCYKSFGDDPYLIARNGAPELKFSAWEYAEEQSAEAIKSASGLEP